ncbi:hypothetical protein ACTFIZ_007598 [Dictyostelium cf. discoideum]
MNNFNNISCTKSGVHPTESTIQRIVSRRIPIPTAPPIIQEPENQIIPDPRGPIEYSLDYQSLQKYCRTILIFIVKSIELACCPPDCFPSFIVKSIELAGGPPYCS